MEGGSEGETEVDGQGVIEDGRLRKEGGEGGKEEKACRVLGKRV